jgi:hypothetical protein
MKDNITIVISSICNSHTTCSIVKYCPLIETTVGMIIDYYRHSKAALLFLKLWEASCQKRHENTRHQTCLEGNLGVTELENFHREILDVRDAYREVGQIGNKVTIILLMIEFIPVYEKCRAMVYFFVFIFCDITFYSCQDWWKKSKIRPFLCIFIILSFLSLTCSCYSKAY